jgi:hypothetical protein
MPLLGPLPPLVRPPLPAPPLVRPTTPHATQPVRRPSRALDLWEEAHAPPLSLLFNFTNDQEPKMPKVNMLTVSQFLADRPQIAVRAYRYAKGHYSSTIEEYVVTFEYCSSKAEIKTFVRSIDLEDAFVQCMKQFRDLAADGDKKAVSTTLLAPPTSVVG